MDRSVLCRRFSRAALSAIICLSLIAPSSLHVPEAKAAIRLPGREGPRPAGYADLSKTQQGPRPNVRVRDAERLNVKWAPGVPQAQIDAAAKRFGFEVVGQNKLGWTSIAPTDPQARLGDLATALRKGKLATRIAEERVYTPATAGLLPNDPRFPEQFGLHNTGQKGGTPDADIDAPEAWEMLGTGSKNIVVAVTDTGIDRTHPDLAANMWVNTREIPGNGRDDDRNGYVDDRYGFDFYNWDGTVYDAQDGDQHGTHVAGIIGAVGDNSVGVTGVNWNVTIMPVKFLGPWGGGDFEAAESILYAVDNGADVINASWGGPYSEVLEEAVQYAAEHGVLICAAAGNGGEDLDAIDDPYWGNYPSSYEATNVIAVAATDRDDKLTSWSNYGASLVDVAAPGDEVLSTVPYEDTAFYIERLPYRIVYNPFVLEALEPASARDQMIAKSVQKLGAAAATPILVVDDSMADLVGDTPGERLGVYTAALAAAGYTNVTTWNTEDQGTPSAATLHGKVVVWFTGRTAYGWYPEETVNADERTLLASYLDNGGRLVMASGELATDMEYFGADWEWFEEYFRVWLVDLEAWGRQIVGRSGNAFAGITASVPDAYTDYDSKYWPTGSDSVIPMDEYARPMARIGGYTEASGTSMAAPMVSGAAALLMSALPGTPAEEIRARLENTVDLKSSLSGRVAYDGRINVSKAFQVYPGKPTLLTPRSGAKLRAGETELVSWRRATGGSPDATFTAEYGLPYLHGSESFESGDLAGFETTGGADWFATNDPEEVYDGSWAVRSGDIGPGHEEDGWIIGEVSVLSTTVVVPDGGGVASFWWWWDADDWDTTCAFEVDGRLVSWPWETFDWTQETVALSAGEHTLSWWFVRFEDKVVGKDGIGIDDVRVTAWDFDAIGDAGADQTSLDWTVPAVDTYNAKVRVRSQLDGVSSAWAYANDIRISTDVLAPGPVTGLSATPDNDGHVALEWTNPADPDLERVKVLRREGMTPTGPDDCEATVVYEGTGEEALDGPLVHGTDARYAAFATDEAGNWSEAATAQAVVVDTVAPQPPSLFIASMYEGAPAVSWMNPPAGSFDRVKVLRKTTGNPTGPNDTSAELVYEGSAAYAIDHLLATQGFEGTAYYGAWAIDVSDNVSSGVFDQLLVDTKPPRGTFVLNSDEMYSTSAVVTANSSVTGATQMRFHLNGEYDEDAAWEPYAATRAIQLLEIDGPQSVHAQYRDAVGNVLDLYDDIWVNLDPPQAPTGVTATAIGAKVKVSWDNPWQFVDDWEMEWSPWLLGPVDSAEFYEDDFWADEPWDQDLVGHNVWVAESPSGPWESVTPWPLMETSWLVGGLVPGQTYYFRVTAFDAVGYESEPSEVVSAVPGKLMTRASGPDRYASSAAVSSTYWESADTVVVATGVNFADALGASSLAGCYEAPVLLTKPGSVPAVVAAEIERLGATKAVIIGGEVAIEPAVAQTLETMGLEVQRIAGKDRWNTAALIAHEVETLLGDEMPTDAFVVNGYSFADALSAAPVAYRNKMPILLTKADVLPPATEEALTDLGTSQVLVVGGERVVWEEVAQVLPGDPFRIAGVNRYATAVDMAYFSLMYYGGTWTTVGLASGVDFPDGLSGGAAVGKAGGVLLLTKPDVLPDPTAEFFFHNADYIGHIQVTGGTAAVGTSVTATIRELMGYQ